MTVFGLGDLVAYLYNDTLCRDKLEEILKDDQELNRVAPQNPDSPFGREVAAILAKNQRWAKLSADDDVVLRMCVNAFAPVADGAGEFAAGISSAIPTSEIGKMPGGPMSQMQPLWKKVSKPETLWLT